MSGPLLALDTATRTAVVALGTPEGALLASEAWRAGYVHGERLLEAVERVLARAGRRFGEIGAVVVGTGPGAFTGLRVGLATAKGLAYGLERPILGIETALALAHAATRTGDRAGDPPGRGRRAAAAAARRTLVVLPAGPADRYAVPVRLDADGTVRLEAAPRLVVGGSDPFGGTGDALLVAVDLDGAPLAARSAGERALGGLARALVELGSARLARGEVDDLSELGPVYVTLPRGIRARSGEIAWSRDLR